MNITANCSSVTGQEISIDITCSEIYPQTFIQVAEYDVLDNNLSDWQTVQPLTNTNTTINYNFLPETHSIKVRLMSTYCPEPTPTPTPTVSFDTSLIINDESNTSSGYGVAFNSSMDNILSFNASNDLSYVPSTFRIYINNEEKALITFWGNYLNQPFIFNNNGMSYNGSFTNSNRIDF